MNCRPKRDTLCTLPAALTSVGIGHGRLGIEAQAGRVGLDGIVVSAGGVAIVAPLPFGAGHVHWTPVRIVNIVAIDAAADVVSTAIIVPTIFDGTSRLCRGGGSSQHLRTCIALLLRPLLLLLPPLHLLPPPLQLSEGPPVLLGVAPDLRLDLN